jgi:NADPH:quinone reductase-like Zn-dependent oxidoreductase
MLGSDGVMDYRAARFYETLKNVDAVLDTVGGETLERSYEIIKPGGIVVSSQSSPPRKSPSNTAFARFSSSLR